MQVNSLETTLMDAESVSPNNILSQYFSVRNSVKNYSRTSVARTLMARLPRLF